jgi:hypothetical protein
VNATFTRDALSAATAAVNFDLDSQYRRHSGSAKVAQLPQVYRAIGRVVPYSHHARPKESATDGAVELRYLQSQRSYC